MAKLVTIDEILNGDIEDGMVIPSITGKLTKLFKPTETNFGFLQNGELTDEQGSACRICFVDTDQEMSARGKIIHLESNKGDHGFQGVKRKDDKQGNVQIWVTGSATITYPAGGGGSARQQTGKPANQNTRSQSTGAGASGKTQQQQPTANQNMHPLNRLKDLADLQKTCVRLVNENVGELFKDRPELVVNMAVSLFIQADRTGIATAWDANTVHKVQLPPPPTDPKQWKDCYITSGKNEGKKLPEVGDEDLMALFKYYDEKGANHALAECVYQAAEDRGLLKPKTAPEPEPAAGADDDIPF